MADFDLTGTQTPFSHVGARAQFMLENRIDFRAQNVGSTETVDVFNVHPGWFVQGLCVEVETAEGGTATVDVGDSVDPDGFLGGTNINALGFNVTTLVLAAGTPNTVSGYTGGRLYTAADTIELLANNALDGAVVVVRALVTNWGGVV